MGTIKLIPISQDNPRARLCQWDLNRQVKIRTTEENTEVHFAQAGDVEALVVEPVAAEGGCVANIPNILLQDARNLTVYVVKQGATIASCTFQIMKREKPTEYVYTETECLTVQDFVNKALIEAKASGDFKGDKGDKGDAGSIEFKIVDELPTEDIDEKAMYLVPITNDDDSNNYLEYIYVDGRWECIDTIQFDGNLDDYVKKTDIDYEVKEALTDCKLTGDDAWTEEEKASALALLGALPNAKPDKKNYSDGFLITINTNGELTFTQIHGTSYFEPYTIPMRDVNGMLYGKTPTSDTALANKKYVDDLVGDVQTIITELHAYAEALKGGA